ncbi:insulinase family protein [Caldalkalibacillus thermarum TA2.A1]|uniref:Insulinase family protein n=1 Tax=Caldalkalibacillus thermarum (strain TA2.A1) TaxID=986075 RepID=A0A8X8L9Z2_CALTT|nr:pitrilysin family protein [Caldalkalibacillus thermarum]QZT32964.1 insulinase family protein [Caldalkalibacillus thermarum TA2.A1]
MSAQKLVFDQLQETLHYEQLPNGLEVYVLPKQGFNKTYATFTTKFGSIDNHFISHTGEEVKVPDGIAHFLEHKMFEEEEGDVFHKFSQYGAQANAFTSFDMTAYLFSCTDHVHKNLTTLLDFVQHPYFTDQNVEKEKGIIEQEIRMYQDNPDWRVYFGFIEALYHRLPVKIDIAGTVDSIRQINKELLYICYETFYHPSNMLLFVVGNVQPDDIFALVKENQAQKSFQPAREIKRLFEKEPAPVAKKRHEIELNVDMPKISMGYKETNVDLEGKAMLKQELSTHILLEMIISPTSSVYEQLMEEGLIDESFGIDYNLEQKYGFSIIGGNSKDPDKLLERVQEVIAEVQMKGLSKADFERNRKKKIGHFLKALNSPEFIATQFTRYKFNHIDLFDIIPVLESLRFEDIEERLAEHIHEDQFAVCIVK